MAKNEGTVTVQIRKLPKNVHERIRREAFELKISMEKHINNILRKAVGL